MIHPTRLGAGAGLFPSFPPSSPPHLSLLSPLVTSLSLTCRCCPPWLHHYPFLVIVVPAVPPLLSLSPPGRCPVVVVVIPLSCPCCCCCCPAVLPLLLSLLSHCPAPHLSSLSPLFASLFLTCCCPPWSHHCPSLVIIVPAVPPWSLSCHHCHCPAVLPL